MNDRMAKMVSGFRVEYQKYSKFFPGPLELCWDMGLAAFWDPQVRGLPDGDRRRVRFLFCLGIFLILSAPVTVVIADSSNYGNEVAFGLAGIAAGLATLLPGRFAASRNTQVPVGLALAITIIELLLILNLGADFYLPPEKGIWSGIFWGLTVVACPDLLARVVALLLYTLSRLGLRTFVSQN